MSFHVILAIALHPHSTRSSHLPWHLLGRPPSLAPSVASAQTTPSPCRWHPLPHARAPADFGGRRWLSESMAVGAVAFGG